MRPSLVLCLAGAAAALSIVLVIALSSSEPSTSAAAGAGATGPSTPSDASPRTVAPVAADPGARAAAGALHDPDATLAVAASDPSDPNRELEAERTRQVAAIEAAVRAGPRDSWAVATEPALAEQFRGFLAAHGELELRLTEVRCSARLCRIELASPDLDRAAAGLAAIGELMPWRGERLLRASPGARPTLVVLAAREHTPLVAALE